MASVVIRIDTDGTAFHTGIDLDIGELPSIGRETARILRVVANDYDAYGRARDPRDSNGHPCGTVEAIE